MPFCALCGIDVCQGKKRVFCPRDGAKFVQRFCQPTPYLYARLVEGRGDGEERQYVCIPCINWKRRIVQGSIRRRGKLMLQLDRMIMFLMEPGRCQEPDMRCMGRLVQAVRQASNPYLGLFPGPARWIAGHTTGDTYMDCVVAWWEYNGRTEFFSCSGEARRVRCAVKAGLV